MRGEGGLWGTVWAPNLLTNSPFLKTALGLEYWEEKLAQQPLSVHKLRHLACAQPASDFPQDLFEEAKSRPAPHLPLQAASVSAHHGASSQSSPASSPLCSQVDQSTPRILYMALSVRDVSSWFSLGIVVQDCSNWQHRRYVISWILKCDVYVNAM